MKKWFALVAAVVLSLLVASGSEAAPVGTTDAAVQSSPKGSEATHDAGLDTNNRPLPSAIRPLNRAAADKSSVGVESTCNYIYADSHSQNHMIVVLEWDESVWLPGPLDKAYITLSGCSDGAGRPVVSPLSLTIYHDTYAGVFWVSTTYYPSEVEDCTCTLSARKNTSTGTVVATATVCQMPREKPTVGTRLGCQEYMVRDLDGNPDPYASVDILVVVKEPPECVGEIERCDPPSDCGWTQYSSEHAVAVSCDDAVFGFDYLAGPSVGRIGILLHPVSNGSDHTHDAYVSIDQTPPPDCGDVYEPDNTCATARTIQSGVPQTHSICPATDVDWAKFTLSHLSSVVIETSGVSGDTRMWLYSDCGGTLLEYDDDDGTGSFSRIDRYCGVDALPAGTYYVKIDEYGNNSEIPSYSLSLTVSSCAVAPNPPSNPGATNLTTSSIRWTWADNSADETGFKVYADPGACPPVTLRETIPADGTYWDHAPLTANCQYCFQVCATNSHGDSSKTTCIIKYTLAQCAESTDGTCATGNVYCTTAEKNTCYGSGKQFTFANPCGFGTCGKWKASKFEYKWNKSTTEGWSTAGTSWNTGEISLAADQGDGDYYLHVRAFNGDNVANNTNISNYGPFKSDTTPTGSSAGPLDCGYTSAVIDVPFVQADSGCGGTGVVNLWYRCRSLAGGEWGAWTKYNGDFTVSPVAFDSRNACQDAEYEFYTLATDGVGNLEVLPPQADCGTKILVGGLAAPVLNSEPEHTAGVTNEISWIISDPIAALYRAQCSQDAGFASVDQDTGCQPRPPDCYTFGGLTTGTDYYFRVRSGYELCPTAFGTWSQTSQADFETDTRNNVSTSASPGDVVLAGSGGPPATNTVGTSTTSISAGAYYRLNCFYCTSSRTLTQIEIYLGIATSTQLQFVVYEGGTTQSGTYNRIHANTVTSSGTGTKFYSSGAISVGPLQPGKYYLIGAGWQGSTTYYWGGSHPVAVAFGNSVASYLGSGYPPPSTLIPTFISNVYYFRLTSAGSGYVSSGTITSTLIAPSPFATWGTLTYTKDTSGAGTALTVDVLDGVSEVALLTNVGSGTDLGAAGVSTSPVKLRANLSTSNSANTPKLSDWAVSYTRSEQNITASDWSNVESSSQLRVCGLTTRYSIMPPDLDWVAFRVWGRATVLDGDSFELDYGAMLSNEFSAVPIQVFAPGHGLHTGDYAEATGLLNVETNPWTLTCESRLVRKL